MPEIVKKLKTFRCRVCKAPLAETDGVSLFFKINDYDTEIKIRNFPFPCRCGEITIWRGETGKIS